MKTGVDMCRKIAYRRLATPAVVIIAALYLAAPAVIAGILVDILFYRILAIMITLTCVTLACMAGVWIVRYFNKIGRIAEGFGGEVDFNIFLEGCREKCGNYHFFTDDSLVTFEAPAQIFYSDITEICSRRIGMVRRYSTKRTYHHELFIRTQSGENYFFKRFRSETSGDDDQDFLHFITLLEKKCPGIRNGGSFPSSSEIFKAHFN